MFVGGEFYADPAWRLDAPAAPRENTTFLSGGTACLTVISDFLLHHGMGKVLLPSYLCPSIVRTFERCGVGWDFYEVNEDLSIDLDDLARKATPGGAVYFIHYFGFFHSQATQDFLQQLRQKDILLIEDNAQAGFPARLTGDFAFNSIRKLAGHDGGFLTTRHDLAPFLDRYRGRPNPRLPLIRAYRQGLYGYLFEHRGSHAELEQLFQRAEGIYESNPAVLGDADELEQIQRLDWEGIRQARRENYQYLMHWVRQIPEISPIFPELQTDNLPMGLPVYFSGVSRDRVNEELGKAGIGLTIHWEEIGSDPRTRGNARAVEMAGRMLTLVIDQRIRRKQMDYLAEHLIRGIRTEEILHELHKLHK